MKAVRRVRDSGNNTVGFLLDDGNFYTLEMIKKNINVIENLTITKSGVIRSKHKLQIVMYKAISRKIYTTLSKQNPFARDIQKDLLDWKNDPLHKVLQSEGSRQIGKTTELLKFGYKNYEYVIYVNLASDDYNFQDLVLSSGIHTLSMETYCRQANLPSFVNIKNTLLILDEIQVSPKAYNSVRSIHHNLKCDLIVTGSYLGQILNSEYFQPAGTVSYLEMTPLSFGEFCRVFDKEDVLQNIDMYGDSDDKDYQKLLSLYNVYRQIGGYPEVVKTYLRTRSIEKSLKVVDNLMTTFSNESAVYLSKEPLLFRAVFKAVAQEMANEKRGTGASLIGNLTSIVNQNRELLVSKKEVMTAIQWLIHSGIIGYCDLFVEGNFQNIAYARRIYFRDCGLVNYILNSAMIPKSSAEGLLSETFVYDELYRLHKESKLKRKDPSFSTKDGYELDFLVATKDFTRYGIEVKTSKGSIKSLTYFKSCGIIDKMVVAKETKGGKSNGILTIPIFTISRLFK